MAANKPTIPKGTRDFGPAEVQRRKYVLNTIEGVFKKYGFMPIETPTMENLTTLEGKYGDEGDKLLFRILNSGNPYAELTMEDFSILIENLKDKFRKDIIKHEDFLEAQNAYIKATDSEKADIVNKYAESYYLENAQMVRKEAAKITKKMAEKGLRYDLTVPFARYVVMNRNEITFPFKRYQMQPVWRADRPQKGRYREFWQCDADVVGSDSLLNEVDLIQIYIEVFSLLKIPIQVKYNNRKLLDGLSQILGIPDKLVEMTIALDKQDKIGIVEVANELRLLGADEKELNNFLETLNGPFDAEKVGSFFERNEISQQGMNELKSVSLGLSLSYSEREDLKKLIVHDLALARGLSYYTGAIFEVVSTEGSLKSSIGGGGRYDNLTGIFGLPNVSGVGISFGLDRIYDVMEELKLFPNGLSTTSTKVLICTFDQATQAYALAPLRQLRDAGIAAELYPDLKKLGKQLDYANALQIPYAMIIGDNEMQSGKLVLKDLTKGTQQELSINEIVDNLK